MSGRGIQDYQDAGIWPLQDHEQGVPLGMRQQIVGCRVMEVPEDPDSDTFVEVGVVKNKGSIGDIHPWFFWQTRDRDERPTGAWSMAWSGLAVEGSGGKPPGSPTTTSSSRDRPSPTGILPFYGGLMSVDGRMETKFPGWPKVFPRVPKGMTMMVMPGMGEGVQHEVMLKADPRLMAVNVSGPGDAGTLVCDLQPENEICMSGSTIPGLGGRHARLQSMMRVIAIDSYGASPLGASPGNGIAWNLALSTQDALLGYGLCWAQLEAAGGGPITPGGTPVTPKGPITPGLSDPRRSGSGRAAASALGGGYEEDSPEGPSYGFGGTDEEGGRHARDRDTPDRFGLFKREQQEGFGLLYMAQQIACGPITAGAEGDKHRIGQDKDGHPMNSGHLSTNAYFYRNAAEDGPFYFEDVYTDPDPLPLRTDVHLVWDGGLSHKFVLGSRGGMWRWEAEFDKVVPGVKDPKPPTITTTPRTPGSGGPPTPGGPGTPVPGTPVGPPFPGIPGSGGPTTPGGRGTPTPGSPPTPRGPRTPGGGGGTGSGRLPGGRFPFPTPSWWEENPGGRPGASPGDGSARGGLSGSGEGSSSSYFGGGSGGAAALGGGGGGGGGTPWWAQLWWLWHLSRKIRSDSGGSGAFPLGPRRPPGAPPPPRGPGELGRDEDIIGPYPDPYRRDEWGPVPPRPDVQVWIGPRPHLGPLPLPGGGSLNPGGRFRGHLRTHPGTGRSEWIPNADYEGVQAQALTEVGELSVDDKSLFVIHNSMMNSYAAMAWRPQLWIKGYPNFEHNPQFPGYLYKAEETSRPQVLAAHAWGAQDAGDWKYLIQPEDSRARGGLVNGGLLLTPPEFEMEDYFAIKSITNVDAPTSTAYFTAAPGVRVAFGKPNLDGGLNAEAVIIGQDHTATNDPLLVQQLNSSRVATTLLSAVVVQSTGEIGVGVGTAAPHASAALEVNSTTLGFLPPVMTTTQRDAIVASVTPGLTIYNTTTDTLQVVNNAGSWVSL